MQTNVVAGEGYSIIQLIGKLDSDTAAKVEAVFTETTESQTRLLLDLAKLKYISSAGLRILLLAAKRVQQKGGCIVLFSLQPNVREIFDISGFSSMFDGKTLDGWRTSTGNAAYSVKDGCIYGVTDPKMKQNSFLVTERSDYENFIFTCEFKWEEFGNSGVIFRGQIQKTEDSGKNGSSADAARLGYKIVGPQAEMDDNPKRRWSAGIYNEGAEWKYSLSRKDHENARNAVCLDGWNRMTIKCVGDRIQTWLNGVPVSDLIWKGTKPGFFGLQVHMGKTGKILWRNLKIKELK